MYFPTYDHLTVYIHIIKNFYDVQNKNINNLDESVFNGYWINPACQTLCIDLSKNNIENLNTKQNNYVNISNEHIFMYSNNNEDPIKGHSWKDTIIWSNGDIWLKEVIFKLINS